MIDEKQPRRGHSGQRPAVAHLAEILAQAQAAARAGEDALEADSPVVASSSDASVVSAAEVADVAGNVGDSDRGDGQADKSLRDRIGDLEEIDRPAVPVDGSRPGNAQGSNRRRFTFLYVVIAVLVLAVPALVTVGYRLTRNSTTGVLISGAARPSDPGYLALVEPTPVALVVLTSSSGEAEALTMLTLDGPGQHGGAAIAIPVDTRLSQPRRGVKTFRGVVDAGNSKTIGTIIGAELGLGFTDTITLTDDELARFVAPVAPLKVENPVDVTTQDGEFIPAGKVSLSAAEVPAYLAAHDANGSIDGKAQRQLLVWRAWIEAIAREKGRVGAIPGETTSGLGRYLHGLVAGQLSTAELPNLPAAQLQGRNTVDVDSNVARLMIANAVPFPVGAAPGSRFTVSLLNGTGSDPAPTSVIQRLTYVGAQIVSMGNAPRFDYQETTLTYSDPNTKAFAGILAKTLGAGRIQFVRSADPNPQVTVIMGKDLLSNPPAAFTIENLGN